MLNAPTGFRVVSVFGQYNAGRECGRLFVLRPGRAEYAPHAVDILANLSGVFSECFLRAFGKIAFADTGYRNVKVFKGMAESLPEEFTFRRVN
jgi:hypothetical protein